MVERRSGKCWMGVREMVPVSPSVIIGHVGLG